jgi:hypothetical protein
MFHSHRVDILGTVIAWNARTPISLPEQRSGSKMSMTTPPARKAGLARLCSPRSWLFSCAGLAALSLVSSASPTSLYHVPQTATPEAPVMLAQAAQPATTPAQTRQPMEEPLQLIAEALQTYGQVQDYSCTLIKKEKLDDQPLMEDVMCMRVRTAPFSVNLKWLEPKALVGQEAVYVAGKNDGKMRVKSAGLLSAVGFVTLDLSDARARKTSKHSIAEAGIGNLLERYSKGWENERLWNKTQVHIAEYEYDKRRCIRVETTHPDNPDGRFLSFRNVIYFDKETRLPVRVECFDWPLHDGDEPELREVYSYTNMKLNVHLTEDVFDK